MLAQVSSGRYTQLPVNRGLPAKYLVKYFTRHGTEWQIKPELRRMIKWSNFNLKHHFLGLGPFDLVMCRNVLVYFDSETKRRILGNIRSVLVAGGYLVLGASETTLNIDENYVREQMGPAIMYRRP